MRNSVDIDGNLILRVLTETSGLTFVELEKILGIDTAREPYGHMQLRNCLYALTDAGLVTVDDLETFGNLEGINATDLAMQLATHGRKMRASDHWTKITMALNYRWPGGQRNGGDFSAVVHPLFGAPKPVPNAADLFVLMPFAPEFTPIYVDHIQMVARRLGMKCMRADDFFTSDALMYDVWSGIAEARVVIADCTGKNPNVFYEIGIAHTLGKPVVLLTQVHEDVPADLRHIRYIHYRYTPPGMAQFEAALAKTVEDALEVR